MTRKADFSLSRPAYEGRNILLHLNSLVSRGLQDVIQQKKTIADIRQSGAPNVITNSIGMKMVLIPAGDFLMGSADSPEELARLFPGTEAERYTSEQPQHRVKITQSFAIGQYPVTVREFGPFVDDTGYETDAETVGAWVWTGTNFELNWDIDWRSPGVVQTDDHPVVLISWNDAQAYCQWLSRKEGYAYRLPTEAEWEYACRAGSMTRFSFGDDFEQLREYCWYIENCSGATHPVGQKKPNGWGLYDMHGNVWEWCADWRDAQYYQQFAARVAADPTGPTEGSGRVNRGGSWRDGASCCRSASRHGDVAAGCIDDLGFRLVGWFRGT